MKDTRITKTVRLVPLFLFILYTLTAVTVILFGIRIYRNVTERSSLHADENTAIAYIREKIAAHDTEEAVSIGTFHKQEALILKDEIEGNTYLTYIYAEDGSLKELYVKDGTDLNLVSGTEILPIASMDLQMQKQDLLKLTITDLNNQVEAAWIEIVCGGEQE